MHAFSQLTMLDWGSCINHFLNFFNKFVQEISRNHWRFLNILYLLSILFDKTLIKKMWNVIWSVVLFFNVFLKLFGHNTCFSIFNEHPNPRSCTCTVQICPNFLEGVEIILFFSNKFQIIFFRTWIVFDRI